MPRISVLFCTKSYGFNIAFLALLIVGGVLSLNILEKQSELVPERSTGQGEETETALTTMYRSRDAYERTYS